MAQNVIIRVTAETGAALAAISSFQTNATRSLQALALAGVGALTAVTAAAGLMARNVSQASIELDRIQGKLRAALGGGAVDAFEKLVDGADRLAVNLEATSNGFAGLAAATKGTALEGRDTEEVFLNVAAAARVVRLSTEDYRRVMVALQQIASKGVVSSEELRQQLGEALPGAMRAAEIATGKTGLELAKLLESGKLLATDFLLPFSRALLSQVSEELDSATHGLEASLIRIGNESLLLRARVGGELEPAFSKLAAAFATLLKSMRESEELGPVFRDLGRALLPLTEGITQIVDKLAADPEGLANYFRAAVEPVAKAMQGIESLVLLTQNLREASKGWGKDMLFGVQWLRDISDAIDKTGNQMAGRMLGRGMQAAFAGAAPKPQSAAGAAASTTTPGAIEGPSASAAKADFEVAKAYLERHAAAVEELYAQGNITLAELLDARRQILEDSYAAEKALLEATVMDEQERDARVTAARLHTDQRSIELEAAGRREREAADKASEENRVAEVRESVRKQLEARQVAEEAYRTKLAEVDALVQSGSITQVDAQQRINEAAKVYADEIERALHALEEIQRINPDVAQAADNIARMKRDLVEIQATPQDTSFFGSLRRELVALGNDWAAISQNIAQTVSGSLNSAFDTIGQQIGNMIDGTQEWGRAFANVAKSIIGHLATIVAKYIASMIAMWVIKKLFHSKDRQEASQTAIAWAPAAAASSAGSGGGTAIAGLAALLLVFAAVGGLIAGAFAEGGLTPGTASLAVVGEKGRELVLPATTVARMSQADIGHAIKGDWASMGAGASGRTRSADAGDPRRMVQVHSIVVPDEAGIRSYIESNEGADVIFQIVRERFKLG